MSKEIEYRTAIILVNYNSWEDTIECLDSLLRIDKQDFQIIIIDNSDSLDSVIKLQEWGTNCLKKHDLSLRYYQDENQTLFWTNDKVVLIKASKNLGFANGNNIGINFARQQETIKYFWILNNDTVVTDNSLRFLIDAVENNIGIVGSVLMEYYQRNTIQAVGGKINKYLGSTKHVKRIEEIDKVDYPIGASILVTTDFIEEVGLMEENYFLYYEEIDWVLRGLDKGYKFAIEPKSRVLHKEGGATGANNRLKRNRSDLADLASLRSRVIFIKKFYSQNMPLTLLGFLVVIINRILRGKLYLLPKVIKSIQDGLKR